MPALNYDPIVVADTSDMEESAWLEYRRKGIGGSDVAAVYGQSPFCTTRDLYYTKLGIKPAVEEKENWVAKKYGYLLEDLVAEIFSRRTGLRVYRKPKVIIVGEKKAIYMAIHKNDIDGRNTRLADQILRIRREQK